MSFTNSLALALALPCALLAAPGAGAQDELAGAQAVAALRWVSDDPSGTDCSNEPWRCEALANRSVGPYLIVMKLKLDGDALAKAQAEFSLLSFAWADVKLLPDGSLKIRRTPEKRAAPELASNATFSARRLEFRSLKEPLELRVSWTGRRYEVRVDGELFASQDSAGTHLWGALRAGSFPGRILAVRLDAY